MNERELEQRIENIMEKNTPDNLAAILQACHIDEEEIHHAHETVVPFGYEARRKNRNMKAAAGFLMTLVICLTSILFLNGSAEKTAAIIGLDVNPGIELEVNKKSKVVEATAVNKEGKAILDGMDLTGSDIDVAANAVLGSMLKQGYLNDVSNSILVSVQSEDETLGSRLERDIAKSMNEYLETCAVGTAILGQYVKSDEELKAFAKEHEISAGKAALVKKLTKDNPRLTEESLLKISTQELLLLADDSKELSGQGSQYGKVNTSEYISKDKALDIVLKHAGISRDDVDDYAVEFECDDGQMIYEVEFFCGMMEYEAEIDATVGTVLEFEKEGDEISGEEKKGDIGHDKAKELALSKAGLNVKDIRDYESELDDGVYEIEFNYSNMEYEIEIDAQTGEILDFDKEYDD